MTSLPGRFSSAAQFLIIVAVVTECLVFALLSPSFLTVNNFVNVALQIAIYGILAVGMTLVILTGGIDLSIGSIVALSGVVAAGVLEKMAQQAGLGMLLAIFVGIGIGMTSGGFAGLMITRLRVPPFIVTLALMTVCRGLAFIFTGGFSIGNLPLGFGFLGRGHLGPIPVPVVMMAVVFLGGYLLLSKSAQGRYIYAIGGNEEASRLSGINTRGVIQWVYLLNGALAGLAGITLASRLGKQVEHMEKHPRCVAVGSKILLIDADGWPICEMCQQRTHAEIDEVNLRAGGAAMNHPAVVFRREVVLKAGGYRQEMIYAEDLDLWLRLAEVGELYNLPEVLVHYRMHAQSISHARATEQRLKWCRAVADARKRRGAPSQLELLPADTVSRAVKVSDHHIRWAWQALMAGNVPTARKHAFAGLRMKPFSVESWRLAACAARGH